jgi:hypothetical protein
MEQFSNPSTCRAYWRAHLERWQQSGQSQKAYCGEQDLSYFRFQYWRRKLREDAQQDGQQTKASGFVSVATTRSELPSGLSVVLPNGMQLRGISADNLAVVERLLARLS